MKREQIRLKKQVDNLFSAYDDLANRRFELWFVSFFGYDVDENGVRVERTITQEESEELETLEIECKSAYEEFSKKADEYYKNTH